LSEGTDQDLLEKPKKGGEVTAIPLRRRISPRGKKGTALTASNKEREFVPNQRKKEKRYMDAGEKRATSFEKKKKQRRAYGFSPKGRGTPTSLG